MANKMKKTLSMILVLCMMMSMFSVTVFASDSSADEFISANGNDTLSETVSESTAEYVDENGNNVVVATTETTINDTNEQGASVETTITFTAMTVTDENGNVVSDTWSEDGVEKTEETKAATGTVEIPTTEGESNTVITGDEVGTETIVEGSVESGNYTEETVVEQGSITVETTEIEVKENISDIDSDSDGDADLDYVKSDVTADAENDLFEFIYNGAPIVTIPESEEEIPAATEGYEYVILGSDNSSQFYAAFLYKSPSYEGEPPAYTDADGNNYYSGRGPLDKSYKVDGMYKDGEKVTDERIGVIWGNVAHYVLVDTKSGELITTYCADQQTPTEDFYSYNIENIEDGTYYSEEQAAMIRTVAKNGYWGVADDASTEDVEYGSLEAMKEMMRNAKDENGNAVFTEEEIINLSDGIAMTATQYAIWTFSNYMDDVEFLNARYVEKDADNQATITWAGQLTDVPDNEKNSVDLIFKLYNHLIHMEPTEVAKDTSETIINEDNFIKSMDLTVIKKADDHANNKDEDATNDVYVTDLTFSLEVKPAGNGEELLVIVTTADGRTYKGRIAGDAQEGEVKLNADDMGNYIFSGITLIEGNQNFNITLEGIQNLKEGVYLYTSEVREGTSSQTMVGVANGKRDVNVTMNIAFDLNVEDEVVAVERVWHEEGNVPANVDPVPMNLGHAVHRPLNNIPDEEVPLADAPQTGDEVVFFGILTVLAGISLLAMHVSEKKRKEV